MTLPDGAWWGNGRDRFGACEGCGSSIRLHPNGLRRRCPDCQLADLARRAREARARAPRPCLWCARPLEPGSRAERHAPCRPLYRRQQSGAYRAEIRAGERVRKDAPQPLQEARSAPPAPQPDVDPVDDDPSFCGLCGALMVNRRPGTLDRHLAAEHGRQLPSRYHLDGPA